MKKVSLEKTYNKPFEDAAETKPKINYPLDSVGTTNRPHYISVLDPFDKKAQIKIFSNITVLMNLASSQRGLHMSRVERVLHDISQIKGLSLEKYSQKLCENIKVKQGKNTYKCQVLIEADYERYSEKNISGKPSHEIYKIFSEYEINKKKKTFGIGLMAHIMNACPCAQRWGMRDFHQFLESK